MNREKCESGIVTKDAQCLVKDRFLDEIRVSSHCDNLCRYPPRGSRENVFSIWNVSVARKVPSLINCITVGISNDSLDSKSLMKCIQGKLYHVSVSSQLISIEIITHRFKKAIVSVFLLTTAPEGCCNYADELEGFWYWGASKILEDTTNAGRRSYYKDQVTTCELSESRQYDSPTNSPYTTRMLCLLPFLFLSFQTIFTVRCVQIVQYN